MSEQPPAAPETEGGEASPVVAVASKKKKLLLIGLIVGGVLLIVISAVAGWLLSRGGAADTKKAAAHAEAPAHKKVEAAEAHSAKAEHTASEGAASAGGATDEVALKAEAERLKQDVSKLQGDVQKQTEMLTLSDEAAKLKSEIEALKAQKATLESDKGKIAEGAKQIRAGEKKCVLSGDPAKRMDELRVCLGLSGAKPEPGAAAGKPADAHAGPHWSYAGESGPEYWAKLNPEWKLCANGRAQSPINLVGSFEHGAPPLQFAYKPGEISMVNNGHTVQANLKDAGGVDLYGKRYNLVQLHFHTPSEELVNGRAADMVVHMVHKSDDGKLLVVGVLLNKGKDNLVLKPVFDNLPKEEGSERPIASGKLDAGKLVAANAPYYHFEGSLTTPPCTEGVQWFVMKDAASVSPKQFAAFTALYPFNARPVQAVNGRKVDER
ncbi:carbonic anhydrase family protein [Leeia oryzae]|nr:carbonic anhydrase family protein [Leeia oryzae]